jgi:hypothetical protein
MMNPIAAGGNSWRPGVPSADKTKFASTIRAIVAELEQRPNSPHSIQVLYRHHQIKRRRLYDVTNILIAIGCASRSGPDFIEWHGVSGALPWLLREKQNSDITNYQLSLATLFPQANCVGLASLTRSLLLIFPAIGQNVLNLRNVSAFFSRDTQRYKTTLCKLYQITLILGALGITERTENPCEVRMKPPFTRVLEDEPGQSPLTIASLLNHPNPNEDALEARRAEFRQVWEAFAALKVE